MNRRKRARSAAAPAATVGVPAGGAAAFFAAYDAAAAAREEGSDGHAPDVESDHHKRFQLFKHLNLAAQKIQGSQFFLPLEDSRYPEFERLAKCFEDLPQAKLPHPRAAAGSPNAEHVQENIEFLLRLLGEVKTRAQDEVAAVAARDSMNQRKAIRLMEDTLFFWVVYTDMGYLERDDEVKGKCIADYACCAGVGRAAAEPNAPCVDPQAMGGCHQAARKLTSSGTKRQTSKRLSASTSPRTASMVSTRYVHCGRGTVAAACQPLCPRQVTTCSVCHAGNRIYRKVLKHVFACQYYR
jgi:hypothetical protein